MPLSDDEKKKIDAIEEAVKAGKPLEELADDREIEKLLEGHSNHLMGDVIYPRKEPGETESEETEADHEDSKKQKVKGSIFLPFMGVIANPLSRFGKFFKK